MGEAVMNLTPEQMEAIGAYVRSHLHEWISSRDERSIAERELDQRERIIRVEESLRLGFENSGKMFEQVDKRFEEENQRFLDLIHKIDKRFEQVDKRFNQMFAYFTTGFVILGLMMSLYKFLF